MALGGLQAAAAGQAPNPGGGLSAASVRNQLLAQAAAASQGGGGALRGAFPVSTIDPSIIAQASADADMLTAQLGAGHSVPKYSSPKFGPRLPPSVAAATNVADDIVAQAASAAVPAEAAAASTAARSGILGRLGLGAGALGKGNLLKGGAYAIGGQIAGSMAGGLDLGGEGSAVDRSVSPALAGAGAGAAIGSFIAPGLGTAIGAGVGAVGGGLYGYFTGDKTNKADRLQSSYTGMRDTIQELGATYGLSPDTMANLMLEFEAGAQINLQQEDEDGMKAFIAQLETTLPQTMLQYRMQQEAESKQNARIMGLQKEFAPIFSSIIDRSAINSNVAYEQALHAGDALAQTNPQLAALVTSNAASSRSNQDALMAAYAAQISTVPTAQSMQEQALLQQTMG